MVIAIHLMRWLVNFYDFRFKWNSYSSNWNTPYWLSQLVNFNNAISNLEERYAIKFCFKLGKNAATETYGMLQDCFWSMNQASVFEWHKGFKDGRESMRDDERCGGSREVNAPELMGQTVSVRVSMLRF